MNEKRLVLLCLLLSTLLNAQTKDCVYLHNNWRFKNNKTQEWLSAFIPGTIHQDLLSHQLIPNPYLNQNESLVQWVEKEKWEYKTSFNCNDSLFQSSHIELVFEGLDTYTSIYLNNELVLQTNNMFREWKIDVKNNLGLKNNELKIVFEPVGKKEEEYAHQLKYTLPGDEKIFTRKAQYQYGWDWVPRLVTCGIWKPVYLRGWNNIKVNTVQISQNKITAQKADLSANIDLYCQQEEVYTFTLSCDEIKTVLKKENLTLKKGKHTISFPFSLTQPKLWWCKGLGEPNLYTFNLKIQKGNQLIQFQKIKSGLRTIEVVQEKDVAGKSFYFKLNGKPVYMKGANWIPADNFIPRIPQQKYEELIQAATNANINMLRVWGGGIYENTIFYELCDKYGIMVWQDFMFSCSMYPGDTTFIENVKHEAEENIVRLRNHPCIALWCGNNEIEEGWYNWGWQKQFNYSQADSTKIWNDYVYLFHTILKEQVEKNDNGKFYWPSSPSIGWGRAESLLHGDVHYWGVWWGEEKFDRYKTKVGRFMSEYGFQGLPTYSYYKKFCTDSLQVNSPCVQQHQKHGRGFQLIEQQLKLEYPTPNDFENYVYASQLLQASGIKTAIEAHRRAKPYCMGTLYWQLNDCWPVASWSSIDGEGNYKALYYQVKNSFKDVLLSVDELRGHYNIYIVSDKTEAINGDLNVKVFSLDGKRLWSKTTKAIIPENSSAIYFTINKEELSGIDKTSSFLYCSFTNTDLSINENCTYYFVKPKEIGLKTPIIEHKINLAENSIELSSDVLAKNVYLYLEDRELKLEDNFFDLLPGERKKIKILQNNLDLKKLKIKTLIDIHHQ